MPITKLIHTGTILIGKETTFIVNRGTRHHCFAELNNWLFDYCYAHGQPIVQLPPLDDWVASDETVLMWEYVPSELKNLRVQLKSELIEFP